MKDLTEMAASEKVSEMTRGVENDGYAELAWIFKERRQRLVRVALRITRNQEEAEDVVQDAAVKALVNLNGFRRESRMDTWLYAIIGNAALSRLRTPLWRREVSLDSAGTDHEGILPDCFPSSDMNPEQSCEREELQAIVRSEIGGLEIAHRTAVQLCDLEGWSNAEAAHVLNLNLSRFKARLHRGRQVLGRRLRRRSIGTKR